VVIDPDRRSLGRSLRRSLVVYRRGDEKQHDEQTESLHGNLPISFL